MTDALDLFEKLSLGRAVPRKSMVGTDFVEFADATVGPIRRCLLPAHWYVAPSKSGSRRMYLTPRGWDFWSMRHQIVSDVVDTIRQLEGGIGTVSDVRVATLQRLVTADEWKQAEEVIRQTDGSHEP